MPVDVLVGLMQDSGTRAVKLEHPPTGPKISALLEADPTLLVFGGLGGLMALTELRRGATGTMSGFAFPEILGAVRRAVEEGENDVAGTIYDRSLPLIQFEAQPGISLRVRKELLRRRGVMATNVTRRPGELDPGTLEELDDILRRSGVQPSPDRMDVSA
jgi:4-hydroxy-tetrahydrodipicolinate synthase